jgi:hypothetical protein
LKKVHRKIGKKDYWNDPIMAAKRIAYKDTYIPENLRGKIKLYVKKNGKVVIKNIEKNMKQIPEKNFDVITFSGCLRKNMQKTSDKWEYHFKNKIIESNTDFITFKCPNLSTIFNNIIFNEFYTITLEH